MTTLVNVFEYAANSHNTPLFIIIGAVVGTVAGIVTNRTNHR